jgi:hypothetical protein
MSRFKEPKWDVPGWDWDPADYSWLSSKSGIHKDDTSIFFIRGGRIRHQAHFPHGSHDVEDFIRLVRAKAEGLDDPYVVWTGDTGGGEAGLWVEGTRPPNETDLERLRHARAVQERNDERAARALKRRRPDLFAQP